MVFYACGPWAAGGPHHLASRSAMLQREVLRAEAHALATGVTDPGLFLAAALLDSLAAEEVGAWRAQAALAGCRQTVTVPAAVPVRVRVAADDAPLRAG